MIPEIPLRRTADVARLKNYLGRIVKVTLNPKWAVDRQTHAIYITPEKVLTNASGEEVGILAGASKQKIVIKAPNRSAGARWWHFFGTTTYYAKPDTLSDVTAPNFGRVLVVQRAVREPTAKDVIDQMARAYAIHEHILLPFNKSWAEISASNLRQGGIIDAQLYNYGRNRTWIRGAVLSAAERFGVDAVKKELGVDDMAVMRANCRN